MKIHHSFERAVWLLSVLLVWAACSDEGPDSPVDPVPGSEETVALTLSETEVAIGSDGRYYSVSVTVPGDSLFAVRAGTEVGWICLDADTLTAAGNLLFYVQPNEEPVSRDGKVTFRLAGQKGMATLAVHQRSQAEDDDNALPGGALTRSARVGYGYNMLVDFMNPQSVTEPVLDYTKLVKAEQMWGTLIAEEGRSVQELVVRSSNSIEEMSSWMTNQSASSSSFFFTNKTTQKFQRISEYALGQRAYGYSSLQKTVATRYVDEGKLEGLLRQGVDVFTDDFRTLYDELNVSPTEAKVQEFVRRFGTHCVTYADLGGKLEYMVNFRSNETSRESVERYLKYKNGRQTVSSVTEEAAHSICNSGDSLSFQVFGGTPEAFARLVASSSLKDRYGQVDPSMLGQWLNSVNAQNPASVAMVHCKVQPIWQLFTNPSASKAIISHIVRLARSEGGMVGARLEELSLDNYYRFDLTDDLLVFPDRPDATLVRIGYFDRLPKVEISHEYVPALRSDRRISVIYPIYRRQANIRRGIYPGDADNPPSEVMFSDEGHCYVRPLEGYQPGDCLKSLYYVDGAFYTSDFGLQIQSVRMEAEDYRMDFKGGIAYPVVKIGPGYWLRQNIRNSLEFGEPVDPDYLEGEYDLYEEFFDDMLYANVFYGNSYAFRFNYPGLFDDELDALGHRKHWFVPRISDIQVLETYLGNNCKVLFPGQPSGFEAQFAGYYGQYDDLNNGVKFPVYDLHYNGECCFIASKEVNMESGQALVLKSDYTLQRCAINRARDNWYPVRPFRTSFYQYAEKQ